MSTANPEVARTSSAPRPMAPPHEPPAYPVISPTLPDPLELLPQIRAVFASGRLTCGRNVAELERRVRDLTGVRNVIAVSSGTSGLMLLLRALDLPEGSEVITPSFTFAATVHALLWNRLKPVFCDSEPDSFTLDVSAARRLVTERTSALYPVCVFGVPGDLDSYRRLADEFGLALIFDSAQGLGSAYKGTPLGGFGSGEVFSMSPTKVVTAMEGGLVTTNDDDLAAVIYQMRDYGKALDGEDMRWLGLSARLSEVNAVVALWSLARSRGWIEHRAGLARRYRSRLSSLPGIGFQRIPDYCVPSLNYFTVVVDPDESPVTRDDLRAHLAANGIQAKRYFYPAVHNQTLYRSCDPDCAERLPVASRLSARSLALPLHSDMPVESVDHICDCIRDLFRCASSI
jgi:dTDP-4-amino-4,6-dideoxygalactose transaminase